MILTYCRKPKYINNNTYSGNKSKYISI